MPFRLRNLATLGLLFIALSVNVAVAAKPGPPTEFKPDEPEREAARARSRRPAIEKYADFKSAPAERHFPWRTAFLGLLVLGVAVPFAWRAFRETSAQLNSARDALRRGRGRPPPE
jgi:hypothetical protein